MNEPMITVQMLFGRTDTQSRFVVGDDGWMRGEGRRIDYDQHGRKTVGEWERSGVSIRCGEPPRAEIYA